MTYLSRIRINPLRTESAKLLASPRAMHAAVMGGVADRPTDERILWRLDADNPYRPQLLALTHSAPDWTHIVEAAGWPDAEGAHALVRDYTPLLAAVAVGRRFAFRLTANPVQNTHTPAKPNAATPTQPRRAGEGRPRSHRMPHRTAAHQLGWFLERTERWGFTVPESRTDPAAPGIRERPADGPAPREVRITHRARRTFPKAGAKDVILATATFEGLLEVTDTTLFTRSLLEGIGPAKAYGCGLLTLAPIPAAAQAS